MSDAAKVFEFFEQISSVPHGSDNIRQISKLCCDFAKKRGLRFFQDEIGDVIIYKDGSPGYENSEPVIIQGHMDMVTVKTPDCDIDLENDGLRLVSDEKFLWAQDTSLGADDGIAIAMAMALLDSDDIPHPPIEAVFTINEETGMDGAQFIDAKLISGRRMINIDSEDEGVITAGCAGGVRVHGIFDLSPVETELSSAVVSISGLTGGHSGSEIHKGRANSNCLMGRLLYAISRDAEIRIVSINGGEKDNAIANNTVAEIAFSPENAKIICDICQKYAAIFKNELRVTDPDFELSFQYSGLRLINAADSDISDNIIFTLFHAPNGVQIMSSDIPGLVQTSLNLGVLETSGNSLKMTFCLRSSMSSQKDMLADLLQSLIEKCGGKVELGGAYPAWEYKSCSPLRDCVINAFYAQYGKMPVISVIHAGLECGIFSQKLNGLDCVSIGPDILDIHTVNEKLDISSTVRTWKLLLSILKDLK